MWEDLEEQILYYWHYYKGFMIIISVSLVLILIGVGYNISKNSVAGRKATAEGNINKRSFLDIFSSKPVYKEENVNYKKTVSDYVSFMNDNFEEIDASFGDPNDFERFYSNLNILIANSSNLKKHIDKYTPEDYYELREPLIDKLDELDAVLKKLRSTSKSFIDEMNDSNVTILNDNAEKFNKVIKEFQDLLVRLDDMD